MHIVLLNLSKLVSIPDPQLQAIAKACELQLQLHVAPIWNRLPASVSTVPDTKSIPIDAYPIFILDKPDAPNALGYHDELPTGQYYGKIFMDPIKQSGSDILTGPAALSSVISHEICELFGDDSCNFWADGPAKSEYAVELCDAVENELYMIQVGDFNVPVSNFVTPQWFDLNAPKSSKYDYLGKLTAPFTMTKGGYMIYRKAGKVKQKFGTEFAEWKKPFKMRASKRVIKKTE